MPHKIVHLTSVHPAFDTRIFFKECKFLAKSGFEVVLVVQHTGSLHVDDVWIKALPTPRNRVQRMVMSVWQVLKLAKQEEADIYHFHDPELIPVGLLLKANGKTVVYDVHEDVPRQVLSKDYIPRLMRPLVSWMVAFIEDLSASRFDGIVGATPLITDKFKHLSSQTVNVNNYPIPHELYTPSLDWSDKKQAVCYVGGIEAPRGICEMVEAINGTQAKLLLAGMFLHNSLREEVMTLSGWSQVEELGYLDRSAIAHVMSQAVAGLVTLHPLVTYVDALPVKMFEYMSAGLPVIASNFPLWEEIVLGNDCGICVDPLDPSAIGKAIQYLLDRPEEAKRLGENGRKAVLAQYNWEAEFQKLKDLYAALLR